mgnify:FL=1
MTQRFASICACLWCAVACAQSSPDAATDAARGSGESVAEQRETGSSGELYVLDADGNWVRALESGVESGLSHADGPVVSPPAYIAKLQFDGEVVGDRADVTAEIRVEITRGDNWYELPLALDQALIYDHEYDGDGAAAPSLPRNGETGVRWQFRGAGTHRLTVQFHLPVRTTVTGRQLHLDLPLLPPNYIARAVLRVGESNVVPAEPTPNVVLRSRVLDSGATELECDVSGTRWNLGWRVASADEPPLVRVRTGTRISRDGGVLAMAASQECEVGQGSLSELRARLPSGFELESVRLAGDTRALAFEPLDDAPGWVRVMLGGEFRDTLNLEWRLSRKFPFSGGPVMVDGLELKGAQRQIGTIDIEAVDGYTARLAEDESQGVQREDVGGFRTGGGIDEFRVVYNQQPFKLEYALRPVEANTDGDSESFLLIDAGRNDLYVDVRLDVIRGQVQEVVIDWPGYKAAGWQPGFSSVDVRINDGADFVSGTLDFDAFSAGSDQVRLQLSRAASGSLRTMLHFTRESASDDALEFPLPQPRATRRRRPTLTLASAVNLEASLTSETSEPLAIRRSEPLPQNLPVQFASESARTYAFADDHPSPAVAWSEHQRTVAAETTLDIELVKNAVHVSQEIAYDVSYGYLKSLLLKPDPLFRPASPESDGSSGPGVESDIRFEVEGRELGVEARDNLWRVVLPRDRIGKFRLRIQYVLRAPDDQGNTRRELTVPILLAADAPFESTRVQLGSLRLASPERGWQPWMTPSGDTAWLATTQRTQVQLEVDIDAVRTPQQFAVDSAFVRTWLGDPGQASVYSEYALRDAPRRVALTLPAAAVDTEIRWEGESLGIRDQVHVDNERPGRLVVEVPVGSGETTDGRLCVRYQTPLPANSALVCDYSLEFPRFDETVRVNASYWEVVLPPRMQLSAPPPGMVPQYTWERDTVFWARRPTEEYLKLRGDLARYESIAAPALPRGNAYAYSAIGVIPGGGVSAMALSLIVLIGAGFSLLLGFLYRRIPATRSMLSVLVLGFLGTLAGLWRLELMQLLVQPAGLGLLLAMVAASFDVARHRRGVSDRESTLDRSASNSRRRGAAIPRLPGAPAHTAVFQPGSASEPGRST